MKMNLHWPLVLVCFAVLVCFGCEGDTGNVGPQGPAGEDGTDAEVTCLGCHDDATMTDNRIEFNRSQHGLGEYVGYAGGRGSCARCHAGNGFVEFALTGEVADDIVVPTAWECNTCHGLHKTFNESFGDSVDYALRLTDPVVALFDGVTEVDIDPSSNLCINCHQSRRGIDYYDDGTGTTVNVTSSHAGPHHGPQSNLLMGNNGSIAGSPFTAHVGAGCVGCHMKETSSEEEINVKGGHTFWPTVEACKQCHESATDFSLFGVQEDIEDKLEELGDLLVGEGILEWEVDAETGDSTRHLHTGEYDRSVFEAFWNWIYIEEDRSKGIHNPTYAEDLLDDGIANVDGIPNS